MSYLVELTGSREVGVRYVDVPPPGEHEVLVATLFSGISAGTEMATYRGTNPYLSKIWDAETFLFGLGSAPPHYPVQNWGYSEVGRVEQLGAGVTELSEGDVVWGIWGHRSHAVLAADSLQTHRMPVSLDPVIGTFDRVGAVALNAVLAAQANLGEAVAVFGLGVIGLLTTQLLVSSGVQVFAVDTVAHRLDLAGKFGATPVSARGQDVATRIRSETGGRGADRVIELTGSYPALQQAIRVAGRDGEVIAAGFYQGAGTSLVLGEEFHHNRVTVRSSQIGAVPAHLQGRWTRERLHETVIMLCAQGKLDPAPLVTHVLPAVQADAAYRLIDAPPDDLLQVVLSFDPDA
jgi:2-desacetyl-2-hydroxyethyl bacteriochlorophyllide A dehydrogenase